LDFIAWLPTAAVTALAAVLWKMGNRVINKLDALEDLMKTELRTMDVRLTRIESHLWPHEPRQR
jgi:4-hydroxybenzoate polyprenyltransferase